MKPLFATFILAAAAFASGCATVTKGTTQTINLHTDPDGATCEMTREEKMIGGLSATPGQVNVDKAWGSISVACRKTGYQPADVRVDSEVQGWTFGNILLGGLIGFAIDAASGAIRQYPQFITLTLVPDEFPSIEERDRYIAQRIARFEEEAAKATAELDKNCASDTCAGDRKALNDAKEFRVALLRERADKARIRTRTPSDPPAVAPLDAIPVPTKSPSR